MKIAALAVLLAATFAVAQDAASPRPVVFRLEYTITEMDGAKKLSSRSYTLQVEDRRKGTMRVGTRVPITTGGSQFQYMDVGVNLDATASTVDATNIRLETTADITSIIAPEGAAAAASQRPPVTRSCRDYVSTIIPLDKTVTLTTQDDPSYNTSMQVQVLVKIVK
jgi:hypothetical protein